MKRNKLGRNLLIQSLILTSSLHPLIGQASRTTGTPDSAPTTFEFSEPPAEALPVRHRAILMRPSNQENVYQQVCYTRELTGLNPDATQGEQLSNNTAVPTNLSMCMGTDLEEVVAVHNTVINNNQYAAFPIVGIAWGFFALATCYQTGKQTWMVGQYVVRDIRADREFKAKYAAWEQMGKPEGKEPKNKPAELHTEFGDSDLLAYYGLDASAFITLDAIRRSRANGTSVRQNLGRSIRRGTILTSICAVGGATAGAAVVYIAE